MKKIVLLVVFLSSFISSNSQILEYFTANDGYESAYEEVSKIFLEPKLFFIGAPYMDNEVLGPLRYDFKTGKANFWIYGFVDSFDTAQKVVVGTMKFFTYITEVFDKEDIDPDDFPYLSENYLDDLDWMDSDTANNYFKQCQPYLEFANSDETPASVQLGLFFNTEVEELPANIPVWAVYIELNNNKGFISPAVNILNSEVYCNYFFTSVNDYLSKIEEIDIQVYNDYIALKSQANLDEIELNIYTIDGRVVYSNTIKTNSNYEITNIPFTTFVSGTYFIVAKSKKSIGFKKFNLAN